MFDEHENGQLRLGAAGDQLPLLLLPDAGIPNDGHEATPAERELERLGEARRVEREAPPAGRYAVKCDDCKAEIRRTDSVGESAAGGYCDRCRTDPAVVGEERARRELAAPELARPAVTVDGLADGDEIETSTGARLKVEAPVGRTRARLERRAEKRREWADSRAAKADAAQARVHEIADGIPFGQPILVGHHSERRHRRDVARIEAGMAATVEHARKADEHASKAEGLEAQLAGAIYSDDVDAAERLEERLAGLEAERDRVKRYNALRRKRKPADPLEGVAEDAAAAGLTDAEIRGHIGGALRFQAYACPLGQFPRYHLENLGGNISRQRQRLEQLRRDRATLEAGGRGRGRPMSSRYPGECAECGETIDRGASIVWYKLTREAVHAGCA